jgi:autotransporter translocation and assembly factor TamB
MRPAARWTLRIAIGVVGTLVLIAVAALIVVHTDWGRERVRARAEQAVAASFPGARIGRVEGSVLGEFVVRDIELHAADGSFEVSAATVRARVGLFALLGKTVHVDHLVAEDVAVLVRTGRNLRTKSSSASKP